MATSTRFLRPVPFVAVALVVAGASDAAGASVAVLFADKVGERVIRAFLIYVHTCGMPVKGTC